MTPRALTIQQAADYCGLSPAGYRAWQADGKVPGPMPGTKRYDRHAIDQALDKLSGIRNTQTHRQNNTQTAEYDDWMAKHARTPETHQAHH